MTGLGVLGKIANAKRQYWKKNGKEAEYLIISQNLYFMLYEYIINEGFVLKHYDETYFYEEPTICGMRIKLIGDKDFLMVGRNEILGLKGE